VEKDKKGSGNDLSEKKKLLDLSKSHKRFKSENFMVSTPCKTTKSPISRKNGITEIIERNASSLDSLSIEKPELKNEKLRQRFTIKVKDRDVNKEELQEKEQYLVGQLKASPPSTSPEDSNIVEKDIKFSSIGKRTIGGVRNGMKKIN
jgi:hypothetical protein